MEKLVLPVQYILEGGRRPQNTRSFITGIGPSSHVIWGRYMGGYPKDWNSPRDIPLQGGKKDVGDET